jgi:hypothetical protein
VLIAAAAASAGEPKFATNVSLQVGAPNLQGNSLYFGRVGGEHADCVAFRVVRILSNGALRVVGPADAEGHYDFLATGPAVGDRVEVLVAATEGPPVCRGTRARIRFSGQ